MPVLSKEVLDIQENIECEFTLKCVHDMTRTYKQRNLCVGLIRWENQNFFTNISTRDITDNKTFWKTVKPLFTDKVQTKSKIKLIEKKVGSKEVQEQIVSKKVISEDQGVAEVLIRFLLI